jgi:Tat protein translocase TatB subunit
VIAFLPTLGFQEILVIVVVGILLFGRNLPDVGRKVGRSVAHLRRSMNEFKEQLNRDETVRELRNSVKETRDEIRRAGTVPRALANPRAAVRDATMAALNAPLESDPVDAGARDADPRDAEPEAPASGDASPGASNGETGSTPRRQPQLPPDAGSPDAGPAADS